MKKYNWDFVVVDNEKFECGSSLLKLKPANATLPSDIEPGQFVNIKIQSPDVFLRRPISICNIDYINNLLWLYVKNVGKGSAVLCNSNPGDSFNILFPLGHGFTTSLNPEQKILLVGGGVGMAPLLFLAKRLKEKGLKPNFILGASRHSEIALYDEFSKIGNLSVTTIDGSLGIRGVVTESLEFAKDYDFIFSCGPTPMMKAVASSARLRNIDCEVSLENHMACGLGACLCCVEDTVNGNQCVCSNGPVFNITDLKW